MVPRNYSKLLRTLSLTIFHPIVEKLVRYIHLQSSLALSGDSQTVRLNKYLPATIPDMSKPVCFFVGAMAHGDDNFADAFGLDDRVSLSEFPLSASVACSKLTNAFEELWNVL